MRRRLGGDDRGRIRARAQGTVVGRAKDRGAPSTPPDLEDRGADGISLSSCRDAAAGGKTGKPSCRRGSRDFGGAGAGGLRQDR
jgi:hypothetical protein